MGVLDEVEAIARETPPVDNKASRFGNPAFQTFYDKVAEVCTYYCCRRDCSLWGNVTYVYMLAQQSAPYSHTELAGASD